MYPKTLVVTVLSFQIRETKSAFRFEDKEGKYLSVLTVYEVSIKHILEDISQVRLDYIDFGKLILSS